MEKVVPYATQYYVKCGACKALYVSKPILKEDYYYKIHYIGFESCPLCGCHGNNIFNSRIRSFSYWFRRAWRIFWRGRMDRIKIRKD